VGSIEFLWDVFDKRKFGGACLCALRRFGSLRSFVSQEDEKICYLFFQEEVGEEQSLQEPQRRKKCRVRYTFLYFDIFFWF